MFYGKICLKCVALRV